MNQQAQNTLSRLRADLALILASQAAELALDSHRDEADKAAGKSLFDRRGRIVDSLIEHLRRNWTVTERARPQRRVPRR